MAAPAHIARENGKKGGRPKGRKNGSTVLKEEARQYYLSRIHAELDPLIDSQISLAKGVTYVIARAWGTDKDGTPVRNGRFERVTDEADILELLNGDGEGDTYHRLCTKDPDAKMNISLMDRLVDKPKEVVEVSGPGWQPLFALPAGIQPSVTNPKTEE